MPEQDRHDTSLIYKKLTLRELSMLVPQTNWLEYFRTLFEFEPSIQINEDERVVAYGLSYFKRMGKILAKTDRR